MQARNIDRNSFIALHVNIADRPWLRMKGLLGRDRLEPEEGLLITPCQSIHMFFMRFSIDVIFLDKADRVTGLVENIPPFALSPVFWKARKALELSSGAIQRSKTVVGDRIHFSSESQQHF